MFANFTLANPTSLAQIVPMESKSLQIDQPNTVPTITYENLLEEIENIDDEKLKDLLEFQIVTPKYVINSDNSLSTLPETCPTNVFTEMPYCPFTVKDHGKQYTPENAWFLVINGRMHTVIKFRSETNRVRIITPFNTRTISATMTSSPIFNGKNIVFKTTGKQSETPIGKFIEYKLTNVRDFTIIDGIYYFYVTTDVKNRKPKSIDGYEYTRSLSVHKCTFKNWVSDENGIYHFVRPEKTSKGDKTIYYSK